MSLSFRIEDNEILIVDVFDIGLYPRLAVSRDKLVEMGHAKRKIVDVVDEYIRMTGKMLQKVDTNEAKTARYKDMLHNLPAMEFVMPVFPPADRFAKT